jgi:hypothetical protein
MLPQAPSPIAPADPAPPVASADPAPCDACCTPRDWTKIPPLTPMPRVGAFLIPSSGPGYYSGLDWLRGNWRENAPKNPYPPFCVDPDSFFNNDYRYLDDPNNTQFDWSDFYHRIHLCDQWLLSFGGEFRYRYMSEENSRLSGFNNGYNLLRYRAYGDVWYGDRFRVYIEFLSANSFGQALAPLAIDRNLAEIQNLFVDLKFAQIDGNGAYLRFGRQEMLYGSQRLISPLDWANTRRTFQGAKAFWHSDKWDFDVFWVRPLIIDPFNLDTWNDKQNFSGGWATYKPKKGTAIDFYALNLSQYFSDRDRNWRSRRAANGLHPRNPGLGRLRQPIPVRHRRHVPNGHTRESVHQCWGRVRRPRLLRQKCSLDADGLAVLRLGIGQ